MGTQENKANIKELQQQVESLTMAVQRLAFELDRLRDNQRHERETMLTRDVALVADVPLTRSIMTSTDPVTIQDASQDVWQHARSDLFVLVDRSGRVVALHTKTPGFTREALPVAAVTGYPLGVERVWAGASRVDDARVMRLEGRSAIDRYVPVHLALHEHEKTVNADVEHPLSHESTRRARMAGSSSATPGRRRRSRRARTARGPPRARRTRVRRAAAG